MNGYPDSYMTDDTASEVTYFPATDWQHNNETEHYNFTYHYTRLPEAYLTFTFNGSFVAYCSDSNFDHGEFFVTIDGLLVGTRSSYSPIKLPAMVLFSASVAPGPHILRIDNTASRTVLGLDYFITSSLNASKPLHSPSPTGSHVSSCLPSSLPTSIHQCSAKGVSQATLYGTVSALAR